MSPDVVLDGGSSGIRVALFRQRDRFAHSISCLAAEEVLCRSIEGDDNQRWPPSPPLQQLSVEERPEGRVALLVGMAGRSHWSASYHLQDQSLIVDVACRCSRGDDSWLGTTYEAYGSPSFWGCCCGWQIRPDAVLAVRPIAGCSLQYTRSTTRSLLTIRPANRPPLPATVQWTYQFSIVRLPTKY